MKWIALLLISTSSLLGAPFEESIDPQAYKQKTIDQRENYFQTSTPYKISPNVNPISGDLIEEEADLVVAGCEPLSIRRFYNHTAPYEPRSGGWRYNPEAFFVANFEWPGQETFAAAGAADGSITPFKPSASICTFNPENFINFTPSGQNHPLNTKINYYRAPAKEKEYFSYRGEIVDGSGTRRSYDSGTHCWVSNLAIDRQRRGNDVYVTVCTPNCWTPYQLHVGEERRPNGNIICYSITTWKDSKHFRKPHLLSGITAYNSDKTQVLASISFAYNKDKHEDVRGITASGSDGRQISLQHQGSSPILLTAVSRPGQPPVNYGYQGQWVNRVEKPDGRVVTTEYNQDGKVSAQYAPVGPHGEMHPIGRYIYHAGSTEVYDAEGRKVVYGFNDKNQILRLETYQNDTLYRTDRFSWDANGNLIKKTIEDGSGGILHVTEYKYDKNHNPIEETIGDGKGTQHTIYRTFSEDGFNLKKSESDHPGRIIHYDYKPGTNLLISELLYEGNSIRKRAFHTYDNAAICTKTIQDDGSTTDPNNLMGITYRTIRETKPKQTLPCFGLPEIVLEKTINTAGEEILLNKVHYTYTPFGKVVKEDHYDCNDVYCYTLHSAYDSKERLITKTDPLGNKTLFNYDDNSNLTTISGPRDDQYKEITYDKANRPTRIADWQTDGSILITEKQYNKLGQVTAEIDACGNTTRFEYDALGRCLAVIHPDGGVERREYSVLGYVTKEIDPEGNTTTKAFNAFGQPLSIHYADGSEEHFTYHPTGTLSSQTDKNGAITHYTYDIFDHPILIETYSASGDLLKNKTAAWTPFCKLSETDDDLITIYTYDSVGRKIAQQSAYKKIEYTYDHLGRPHTTWNGETQTTEEYNFAGELTQTRILKENALQKQENYTYDEAGNRTQVITSLGTTETLFNTDHKPLRFTDCMGFITKYGYDYANQFVKTITHPNRMTTIIVHDTQDREALHLKKNVQGEIIQKSESFFNKNGDPIRVIHTVFSGTEPVSTITHYWEYGSLGRLERFIEAGEKETRYLYDPKGRLQILVKPDGSQIMHEYDELGRLSRYYAHDFNYRYTYDKRDRVVTVKDGSRSTCRIYDPLNHVLHEILANGLELTNTYDTQGRRVLCTLPDDSKIGYGYNGIYLYSISRNNSTFTYERNLEGQITHLLTPIGETHILRDALGRCIALHAPYFSAEDYKFDSVGNLLHYTYQDGVGEVDRNYAYDDLDQMIQEDGHAYHYDSIHNRLKKDTYVYAINSLCQVCHDGENSYTYDLCGNLTSDGTRTYAYDTLDRLIAVEEGDQKVEYTYDPFHRRLSKTIYLKGFKLKTIRYLWDGQHEIGAVDENRSIQELRILGEGLGAEIGSAVLCELNGSSYVPIHDHRGCVVALIDSMKQKPAAYYRYGAFGEEQILIPPPRLNELIPGQPLQRSPVEASLKVHCPWRFASKRVDEETGLVYFGRRYYHPTLGRWITQDLQGFDDGPNLYAYVHNRPLNEIDFYGLLGIGQCFSSLSRWAFRSLEWTGANLLPIPYVRNFVESVGRWGAGGNFLGPSNYRAAQSEIITIPGRTVPGLSYTHSNGMLTRKEDAIEQAEYISHTHGDLQVDLFYHGTQGLVMDLIGCGLSKLGMPTSYNRMCANYYINKLGENPNHRFISSVHSRGGIQLMNTGRMLSPDQKKQIDVIAYGSATLIPRGSFRSAINNLTPLDIVTMSNPLAFCVGLMGQQYDMNFLPSSSRCPVRAHGLLEETYAREIKKKGDEFKDLYFND